MVKNGFRHAADTATTSAQSATSVNGARRGAPAAEGQDDIHEEIEQPRG
jgi:hypothetical protein